MSNQTIYNALLAAGMTREGACGMMGNMMAESSMRSNIAQRGMTKLSDEQYTAAADNGFISFAHDSCGYGLCQWTYHTRKAALLSFAKARGVSVGDEAMQVQFCLLELRTQAEYAGVWAVLTASHDLRQCAAIVCTDYERPAVNNIQARYEFAQRFFAELAETQPQPEPQPDQASETVVLLQAAMRIDGHYKGSLTGIMDTATAAAFREYSADILKGAPT